jgi:hypothetical protein
MSRGPDLLPDWFVGGAGKRRLIRALVLEDQTVAPWDTPPPWSKQAMARAAGVHPKNAVVRHVEVLVHAGLLQEEARGYRLNRHSPLLIPLRELVRALDRLPSAELPRSRGASPGSR